jgi:hypothetical protein
MKIKYCILVLLPIVAVSIINVYLAKSNVGVSSLFLTGIEAYSGESSGEGSGICKQNDTGKVSWIGTIPVNGVDVNTTHKRVYSCTTNGRKLQCKTGGIYWNNGVEVYNSVTEGTCY